MISPIYLMSFLHLDQKKDVTGFLSQYMFHVEGKFLKQKSTQMLQFIHMLIQDRNFQFPRNSLANVLQICNYVDTLDNIEKTPLLQ